MADDSTRVDVLSLEDFHATLAARRSEVESVRTGLDNLLGVRAGFGTFEDANLQAAYYDALYVSIFDRVDRLHQAIVAAQTATETIIANYRSTEERNHANAADIAAHLGGIGSALDEGQTDGR
jgi:hypothetical protein